MGQFFLLAVSQISKNPHTSNIIIQVNYNYKLISLLIRLHVPVITGYYKALSNNCFTPNYTYVIRNAKWTVPSINSFHFNVQHCCCKDIYISIIKTLKSEDTDQCINTSNMTASVKLSLRMYITRVNLYWAKYSIKISNTYFKCFALCFRFIFLCQANQNGRPANNSCTKISNYSLPRWKLPKWKMEKI